MKRDYTIIRTDRKTIALQVRDGQIIVRAPKRAANTQIDAFVREHRDWIERQIKKQEAEKKESSGMQRLTEEQLEDLKARARREIPERAGFYAGKIGVTYGKITIRSQRTRWGSCSSKGNLNFNCLLLLMPQEVLDSVVVHELCHRKEMNHSRKFYEEVLRVYPDYYKWNGWLKKNGGRYLRMLPDH